MPYSRIRIISTRTETVVEVDGKVITNSVSALPAPVVTIGGAGEFSTVNLTLVGEVDLEVDGEVEIA